MFEHPSMVLTTINLSAPDPGALAAFYSGLLGWPVAIAEPDWVAIRDPAGGVGLSCQTEIGYVAPTWPPKAGEQQMMMHLEIKVDDLRLAADFAVSLGASIASHQPQDDVIVCLDPAGHPFCLWIET